MKKLDFAIQWHITSMCQNHCKHCYMYMEDTNEIGKNELSEKQLEAVFQNINRFEKKYDVEIPNYIITGGDPFSHKSFYTFVDFLYKQNKKITILGIPERINNENLVFLKNHGVTKYQVSLDGLENTHDYIRGEGSFEKTLNAIKLLNEYGLESVTMFTANSKNWREMFDLIEYLDETGLKITFAFDFMISENNGRSTTDEVQMVDPNYVNVILSQYLQKDEEFKKKNSKVSLNLKNVFLRVLQTTAGNGFSVTKIPENYTFCGGCYCGISSLAILPNGDVLPCRRLNLCIGNALHDSFEDLLIHHPLMKKFRNREEYMDCKDCENFKICRGCAAVSYAFTGNPFEKNKYCTYKSTIKDYKATAFKNGEELQELNKILGTYNNQLINLQDSKKIKQICEYLIFGK
jgi:radical SAM protein with 4Fe4S-binding SPASM domain